MKKVSIVIVFLLIFTTVLLFYGTFIVKGESPNIAQFSTLEEAATWLQDRGLDVVPLAADMPESVQSMSGINSAGCSHTPIVPDSELLGPLGINTQVVEINKAFCETPGSPTYNTALIDIGSKWPGDPADSDQQHRVWGLLAVRKSDTMELVNAYAFDVIGIPSLSEAIQAQIEWPGPLDRNQYRFDAEVNARTWPENVGPATTFVSWFITTQPLRVYLPAVFNESTEQCPYRLHVKSANLNDTDEVYCFTPTGISHAELRFSWGETVYSWWEDPNGSKLTEFPGTDIVYMLDSPHSYRDYYTPENEMMANQWYPNGLAPWLATHHELTGQFKLGDITYRVTVPMIWDP